MTNPKCQFSKLFTVSYSVLSLVSYQLLHPAMFGYDGRSRTSIPYWTTFMKNNLPLPPFDIISWRKYTTSLSHHSIHLSVMLIKENKIQKKSNQINGLSFCIYCCGVNLLNKQTHNKTLINITNFFKICIFSGGRGI